MPLPLIPTATALLLLALAIYKLIIHPRFISPLSSIPSAHWSAPYSPLWILYRRYRLLNNATTQAAHVAHGPIIRLAPNELSINCVDGGIRTIYAGGFEKHDWYPRLFPSYGVLNMFSIVGHAEHSAKKRLMSNVYSKSYLQASPQVAANSSTLLRERFLPLIQGYAESRESVDVHEMNNAFAMDFMSAYQFGIRVSTNFTQDVELRRSNLREYHSRKDYEFYSQEVPGLKRWSSWLGIPLVPKAIDNANDIIENWGMEMCDGADKVLSRDLQSPGDDPIVYKQFKNGLTKSQASKNASPALLEQGKLETASEMLDHLGAGHETSAIALTYLYWELSKRPELQAKLRAEVLTLSPRIIWPKGSESEFELPDPKTIDNLPFLHALIMETLRLHAPIPGLEPRITPSPSCTLVGYPNIPPGTRVSAMPYTLHRNPTVFPEPEVWKPERWLDSTTSGGISSEEELKEMARWFWAFGSGGRMCIGSNLAMQEIKLIVVAVYGNWRTEVVNDEGIEPVDAYTTKPTRGMLDLRFVRA